MGCNLGPHGMPEFIIAMITNVGGVLFTIIGLLCVSLDNEMESFLRFIFFSFLTANVIGSILLGYETAALLCLKAENRLYFVMIISVMLSLSHLTILLLSQHISVTSNKEQKVSDFTGLIMIIWLISITIGMMHVVSRHEARLFFAVFFLSYVSVLTYLNYLIIVKHKNLKKSKRDFQRNFLLIESDEKNAKGFSMIYLCTIITFSYSACSMPWAVNELTLGVQNDQKHNLLSECLLVVYSANFFVPPGICIYLKISQCLAKFGIIEKRIKSSYRFRDANV